MHLLISQPHQLSNLPPCLSQTYNWGVEQTLGGAPELQGLQKHHTMTAIPNGRKHGAQKSWVWIVQHPPISCPMACSPRKKWAAEMSSRREAKQVLWQTIKASSPVAETKELWSLPLDDSNFIMKPDLLCRCSFSLPHCSCRSQTKNVLIHPYCAELGISVLEGLRFHCAKKMIFHYWFSAMCFWSTAWNCGNGLWSHPVLTRWKYTAVHWFHSNLKISMHFLTSATTYNRSLSSPAGLESIFSVLSTHMLPNACIHFMLKGRRQP